MSIARICRTLALGAAFACAASVHAQCPTAPALIATPTGCGVLLNWTLVPFATSYNIYRSTSPTGTGTLLTSTVAITYTDPAPFLPAGQFYYYQVVGTGALCGNANHEGAYSNVGTAAPAHMSAPTFSAVNPGCETITFTWNSVPGATSYRVSSMFLGSETGFTNVPSSQTSFTYNYGTGSYPTDFGVTAIGSCESSSRTLVGATIAVPASSLINFSATGQCNGIRLTWAFSPLNASGLRFLRTATGVPNYTFFATLPATSIFDATAAPGITYTYAATPFNTTCGDSGASTDTAAIVPLSSPALLAPVRTLPGQTAHLSASLAGAAATPVTYEWKRNGAIVANSGRISGATSGTLNITSARPEDSDIYTVTATATNCTGTATSTIALVVPNTCPADFNLSGGLEVQDIFDYLNAWFAGCP